MPQIAKGQFTVTLNAFEASALGAQAKLSRRGIDKQFEGDLIGSSAGEMMSAMGEVAGSAGYVALERVTGILHGKRGSFVLQHFGIMDRGTPQLNIQIVPDSGTDELHGIRGQCSIDIVDRVHFYQLNYELPES